MRRILHRGTFLCIGLVVWANPRALAEDKQPASQDDFFEKSVRPVLSANCFKCHGPEKQENNLRLDSRAAILQGGKTGPAVVPGRPEESLLVAAIRYDDKPRMPPDRKLTDAEFAVLIKWVKAGAPWPSSKAEIRPEPTRAGKTITKKDREFWSFRTIESPAVPKVDNASSPKTAIDFFILAELEANGLKPTETADKRTLIRRATFDLIGLPPTPEEIQAFLKDTEPDAFARVVDRLLASPHYGERWARHWLDVARYAEDQAHTYHARVYPNGYRYRDWVVNALNNDMPYDQFIKEQIAGDLLEGPDREKRLAALGFFALGPVYYGDKKEFDQLDDRIDTLTRGFLGLTVACARCHDHKYDPIPTTDYYSLAGVFASTEYAEAPLAPTETVRAYQLAAKAIDEQNQRIDKFLGVEASRLTSARTSEIAKYMVGVWKLQNRKKRNPKITVEVCAKEEKLQADVLNRWARYLSPEEIGDRPYLARWIQLLSRQDGKIDLLNDKSALAEVTEAAEAFQSYVQSTVRLRDTLEQHYALAQANSLDKTKQQQPKPELDKTDAALLDEIIGPKGLMSIPKGRLEEGLSAQAKAQLKSMRADLERLKKDCPPKYPFAHALTERSKPENLRVCLRGNPNTLGEEVPRHFLSVLSNGPVPFTNGSGRLELAKAIARRENPLTARVMVNRIWQHHFGKGLVRTPSNFGKLGERPTHPKLLDHLASKFMEEGWSVKAVHRHIMRSAAYQLSSRLDADDFQKDPENKLMWRMNRRRLEVEPWRDAILAAADKLDKSVGGPSVDLASPNNQRRTLYGKISRHDLNPLIRLFDFPDPNITSDERTVTTVPLQELFVLNSEFMVQNAKALAARLTADAKEEDTTRIGNAFVLLYGRPATKLEVQQGLEYLADREPAEDTPAGNIVPTLTQWEKYAQVLLDANEFLYVN
jgi:hypothetical protein